MWPDLITFPFPVFDQYLRLLQGVKHFTVQQLIPQLADRALDVTVFPRAAWLDKQGFRSQLTQLGADHSGREF